MDSSKMSKYGVKNPESGRQKESTRNDDQLKDSYIRYTREQNQKLQEFYEQNNHPNENERSIISAAVGLDQERVKFWFQNYRSKTRKKLENSLKQQLKDENEQLRSENETDKLSLLTAFCEQCGEQSKQSSASRIELLKEENAHMKEELGKFNDMLANYCRTGTSPSPQGKNNLPVEEPSDFGYFDYTQYEKLMQEYHSASDESSRAK